MQRAKNQINNAFYEELGENWYESHDHPIAFLRKENALRNPWIVSNIKTHIGEHAHVLDVGCGAGFLTNTLAQKGHHVTGIDLSLSSLETAKTFDVTKQVRYLQAHAEALPFENESFDVVCAMDLLEHIEHPDLCIAEASRVLKKDGLFFFHTFNRNPLSWLLIIKGVEWCISSTPSHMHIYRLFIKPSELERICQKNQLKIETLLGLRPDFKTKAFWTMVFKGSIPEDFTFTFCSSLKTGYVGFAKKA